jgi:beta-glucosidase
MWVNAELNFSDAFFAAWLPGFEGNAVADVLFSQTDGSINHDFVGKLSYLVAKTGTIVVTPRIMDKLVAS